jgi:hypothetical protein
MKINKLFLILALNLPFLILGLIVFFSMRYLIINKLGKLIVVLLVWKLPKMKLLIQIQFIENRTQTKITLKKVICEINLNLN